MTEGSWTPSERERPRLPRLDDLPTAPEGYDPQAVREAFDAFYRHAAELDSTLRTLEAVESFQRHAAELRSDIRSLRAASWGPVPAPRADTWSSAHRRRSRTGPGGAVSDAFPRVVVETVFIVVVAVGAAVAGLSTPLVVALVAGAWLIVGAAEVTASVAGPRIARRRAAAFAPSAAAEPSPTVVAPAGEVETGEHPAPAPDDGVPAEAVSAREPADEEQHVEPEPEPALGEELVEEPVGGWPEPLAAEGPEEAVEPEPEPAPEPEPQAEPELEFAPAVAEAVEPEPEPEPEPQPVAAAAAVDPWESEPELPVVEPEPDEQAGGRGLRFWRRRRAPEEEALYPEASGHVQVISVRPAGSDAAGEGDRAPDAVEPLEGWTPPDEYERPPGEQLRRGRR